MAIVTHNLRLSPLMHNDAEDIDAYMRDKTISENTLHIPYPYSIEHARTWLEDNLIFEEENGYRKNYAIRNADGKLLGAIGVHFNYGKESDKSEFGYWLGEAHRNKGIMTEAVKAFCLLVKETFGLKTLEAHVFAENTASQKVLAKAGFVKGELLPDWYKKNGKRYDAIKFERKL